MANKTVRFSVTLGNIPMEVKRLINFAESTKIFGECSWCGRPYHKTKKAPYEVCPACKKAGIKVMKRGKRKHGTA